MAEPTVTPQQKKIIIAIDGHSSCGTSTLARDLADAIGYLFIDTGAMYRAITLKIIRLGISLEEPRAIDQMLAQTSLNFSMIRGNYHLFLDGEDVENEIRKPEVAAFVSPVARISSIRRHLVQMQQEMGWKKGIVMEGRDITTIVFPEAELKLFVTADVSVRANRRWLELSAKGIDITLEEVEQNIRERDLIDSTRADSPLTLAPEAIVIDTTGLTRSSQLQLALDHFNSTMAKQNAS